jgi:hypothetical protein
MIKIGDLIQEPGKPIVRCTQILDNKDLVWMSLDGKSSACDSIIEFTKLVRKEISLTTKEILNIISWKSTKYDTLKMYEAKVYYGDMTAEYTFDIVIKDKETIEEFVIQGVKITEGCSCRWFENDDFDDDFLDKYEGQIFTAKLCVYNPNPPYTIVD